MRRKKKRNLDYKTDLLDDLRGNANFAAEYLSAAYADSRGAFLVALRDVIEARKGIARMAVQAKVNRENLYRSLSERGNPTLTTLDSIWDVLGIDVQFKARDAVAHTTTFPLVNNLDVSRWNSGIIYSTTTGLVGSLKDWASGTTFVGNGLWTETFAVPKFEEHTRIGVFDGNSFAFEKAPIGFNVNLFGAFAIPTRMNSLGQPQHRAGAGKFLASPAVPAGILESYAATAGVNAMYIQ
jgi:probable addiction module antidote protein